MLKTILFISLLFLTACTTTYDTGSFTPILTSDDTAVVYIYRPPTISNAIYSPELFINEEYKISIKNGQSSLIKLTPDNYIFAIEPDKSYSGITQLSLTLVAGHTYYIRVDTSLKIKSATTYEPYQRNFNLIHVDENLAISQIERCCLSKNKSSTERVVSPGSEKQTIDGFSVDKTQNPFSH